MTTPSSEASGTPGTPAPCEWPEARELAERLVSQTGDHVRVVLLYGSRLLKTRPDRHSALDFVVVVDEYRPFYDMLSAADELHRPVGLMTLLAGLLAPNVLAYTPDDGRDGHAKCIIVSKADFERGLGPERPDHFLLARMVQRLGEVWTADADEAAWARDLLRSAYLGIIDWMAPYLEGPVDAAALGRRLLEVCYQGEFRPESRSRASAVYEAQAAHFTAVLAPTLERATDRGVLERSGEAFVLAEPVAAAERRRMRRYFRRSKLRATLRWLKHMITFSNWLPYTVRKVERHTGRTIELTTLERKLPLIFLWPRVIHVLLTRPRREVD